MLVAKGSPAHIHIECRDFDGVLTVPTGTVSIVIKDIDDVTVATGTAQASQHGHAAGVYTFSLPTAVTGELGVYEATASFVLSGSTITKIYSLEVVGEYLFEIHELRQRERGLDNETNYPAESIREARDQATSHIERAAEIAFSPRSTRQTLSGDGTSTLLLPHLQVNAVIGVTVYGEEIGTDIADEITGVELTDIEVNREAGLLIRTDGSGFPVGSNNVVVDYEHGYEWVPAPIRQAAMTLAIEYLVPSGIPVRATSQSSDLGDFRISVANEDLNRPTGIPSVDAVIAQYGRRRPRLG